MGKWVCGRRAERGGTRYRAHLDGDHRLRPSAHGIPGTDTHEHDAPTTAAGTHYTRQGDRGESPAVVRPSTGPSGAAAWRRERRDEQITTDTSSAGGMNSGKVRKTEAR